MEFVNPRHQSFSTIQHLRDRGVLHARHLCWGLAILGGCDQISMAVPGKPLTFAAEA